MITYEKIVDDFYCAGHIHTFRTGKVGEVLGVYRKRQSGVSIGLFVKIKMLDTGYESYTEKRLMNTASGYDPYQPRIAGVGFMGEGKYKARKSPSNGGKKYKSYACWENMLWRVYGENHRVANRYYGRGVEVCEEWHNLQNFVPWFIENFPYKGGFTLDSDLFRCGDKIYSPDTCVFIPQEINKFFAAANKVRGEFPVGVTQYKSGRFTAFVGHGGEEISKHGFSDPDEAFLWYKKTKEDALRELASKHFLLGNISDITYHKLLDWRAVPYPD